MPDTATLQGAADQYQQVAQGPPAHKAEISHELLGGGVAFEACKAFIDHQAANGKPQSHAEAKEILAGIIGLIVDREVETKGMDWIDKEKAKRHAHEQACAALTADDYGH